MPVDGAFWENEARALMDVMLPWIEQATLDGVLEGRDLLGDSLAVDWQLINQQARAWAVARTASVVSQITATSMSEFVGAFPSWVASGLPLDDLVSSLRGAFAPSRARLIAVTETTRAFARGNTTMWASQGVEQIQWFTGRDDRVCEICLGLDGRVTTIGKTFPGDVDGPPAHPGCRCYVQPFFGKKEDARNAEQELEQQLSNNPWTSADDPNRPRGQFPSEKVKIEGDGYAIRKTPAKSWLDSSSREVLAYRIDRALGINMTPVTAYRAVDKASYQAFADGVGARELAKLYSGNYRGPVSDWGRLGFFDGVLGNSDRHLGNFLFGKDDGIIAIDHGMSMIWGDSRAGSYIANSLSHAIQFSGELMNKLPLEREFREKLVRSLDDGTFTKIFDDVLGARSQSDEYVKELKNLLARAQDMIDNWDDYFVDP